MSRNLGTLLITIFAAVAIVLLCYFPREHKTAAVSAPAAVQDKTVVQDKDDGFYDFHVPGIDLQMEIPVDYTYFAFEAPSKDHPHTYLVDIDNGKGLCRYFITVELTEEDLSTYVHNSKIADREEAEKNSMSYTAKFVEYSREDSNRNLQSFGYADVRFDVERPEADPSIGFKLFVRRGKSIVTVANYYCGNSVAVAQQVSEEYAEHITTE